MFKTVDLFAGCGGLSEGFHQTGEFEIVAAVEWEKRPAATFAKRLDFYGVENSEERTIRFDIQRTSELLQGFNNDPDYGAHVGLDALVSKRGVDVVVGGPPCQAYSVAGRIRDENGMHDDYRNFLFESYLSVVTHFTPKACIFENVPGIFSASPGGISIIERIEKAFDDAGYYVIHDLKDRAIFDTSEFSVPQLRKRVIIFGVSKSHYPHYMEVADEFYSSLVALKCTIKSNVYSAISDLASIVPTLKPLKHISHQLVKPSNISDHTPRFHNQRDIEIFRMLANDILSGANEYVKAESLHKLYTEKTGNSAAVHKYHVLRKDKPSNTIPAHLYKDGLRHIHYDPVQARSITVREAARLQSFPDNFEFFGAMGDKYKMIGNAVPPTFAKSIGKALSDTLNKYS